MVSKFLKVKLMVKGTNICTNLKRVDRFGKGLNVNLHGEETFKTLPGAVVSVLYIVIVLIYIAAKSNQLINRLDPAIDSNIVLMPKNHESINAYEKFFQVGFMLRKDFKEGAEHTVSVDELDPRFMKISANEDNWDINENNYVAKPLSFEICDSDNAPVIV